MKKYVWATIFVIMILLSVEGFADNEHTSGLYTYSIKGNGTIIITDYDWESSDGDVYIPTMIDGYTVTSIGDSAFDDGEKEVIVTIPNSVTMICEKAFANTGITFINIPASVQSIGVGFVIDCPNLRQISVDPSNNTFASVDGALYHKATKTLVAYPCMCHATIPEGIISVGNFAFYGCELYGSLNSILPVTIETIGDYAFARTSIRAFSNDNKINIIVPKQITFIGAYAFDGATIFPVEKIGEVRNDSVHYYAKVYVLENEDTTIGEGAFRNVVFSQLTTGPVVQVQSIRLYINVRDVPDYAFYNTLTSSYYHVPSAIVLTGIVSSIGQKAFAVDDLYVNDSLRHVLFDSPILLSVSANAFYNQEITGYVTIDCNQMEGFAFNRTCTPTDFTIPKEFEYMFPSQTSSRRQYTSKIIPTGLNILIKEGSTLIPSNAFRGCSAINSLSVPESINVVGSGAFSNTNLKAIQFSNNLIFTIPEDMFFNSTSLSTIVLPPFIEEILTRALANTSITEITLPGNIVTIGDEAFIGCTNLREISITSAVRSIGDNAFTGCTCLKEIILPASINKIGNNAFERTIITLIVEENSYAALWAQENGYSYRYSTQGNALDWLNN